MYADIYDKIKIDPEFQILVKQRRKFSLILTSIILSIYFSFILTLAYAPSVFAAPIYEGSVTSLGIVVGISIILISFTLTGIYVQKANTDFDTRLNKLKDDLGVKHD
ncbi:DUF485 domain-containing protein [Sulfurimonas sp. MAG313]|nr:DUF485 domain-containing protein [Sulfurimonas sp. MAG313]MDF1882221.1 DUF485 domain-containing protein [Sulfurimonas sp. MAG313]